MNKKNNIPLTKELMLTDTLVLENVDLKRLAESRRSLARLTKTLEHGNPARPTDVERVRYINELLGIWAWRNHHSYTAARQYIGKLKDENDAYEQEQKYAEQARIYAKEKTYKLNELDDE